MSRWREDEHPRRPDGRFRPKGGGWAGRIAEAIGAGRGEHRTVDGDDLMQSAPWEELAPLVPGRVKTDGPDPDLALGRILALQGFDGPPRVVDGATMDRLVSDGSHIEMWRGVGGNGTGEDVETNRARASRARAMADQFRSGEFWPGRGIYGNGTYVGTNRRDATGYATFDRAAWDQALADVGGNSADDEQWDAVYADPKVWPGLLRVALPADANIVDYDQIQSYAVGEFRRLQPDSPRWKVVADLGRHAALLGWDAIRVPWLEGDYYVLLNRTKLVVQEAAQ